MASTGDNWLTDDVVSLGRPTVEKNSNLWKEHLEKFVFMEVADLRTSLNSK